MPETVFDDVFDGNGVRLSRSPRVISDAEIERRDSTGKLRNQYTVLRTWQAEAAATAASWGTMTAGQRTTATAQLFARFGLLCDNFATLLAKEGLRE